ncbi:protein-tyrosine-phosphatase [Rapidithrix thailandica]|uniref:Protein-tyrosine-phosphatase n=1 Tax=Rapidithrix thailandica TaxID=413964 RepID=A0AAW9SHE8_9BACT
MVSLFPKLEQYLRNAENRFDAISQERKKLLEQFATYIAGKKEQNLPVHLNFICTHNSRRSHFGQVWAAVAAGFYQIDEVYTYSGGTEATAFHPNAIAALKRAGFHIEHQEESNPKYQVYFGETKPIVCFSKVYDNVHNPSSDFAAVMTCTEADQGCPVIVGAEARFPVSYQDPKLADGSPQEAATYDTRCLQIATEMAYVFSQTKALIR